MLRAGACVLALAGATACGPNTNVFTGEQNKALNAPLPSASPEMRQQLQRVQATLADASPAPDGGRTDEHALACIRLFDLADLLRFEAGRYDLDEEAYELVADANRECDERPQDAAAKLRLALRP